MFSYLTRVVLIPSAVFLSVLFGGAFGSGREVVEFMSQHGPVGGFISMTVIAVVYSTCLFLSFELARLHQTHEYRGFYRLLLGKGWVVYEVVITLTVIAALAICASSSGAVLNSHFGVPTLVGGVSLLILVVALNYGGRDIVERSMIFSVISLALILVALLAVVLKSHFDVITRAFHYESSISGAVRDGLKYAFTNTGFIPLLLFCGSQLKTRQETLVAGIVAGIAGVAPAISFHLTFLAGYPEVLGETLPTYYMVSALAPSLFLDIYVLILFIMIAQTGVGVLRGLIERINRWWEERTGSMMGKLGQAGIAGAALVASTALASIGLVNLIAQAYKYLSIIYALIFVLPLLAIGIPRIIRASATTTHTQRTES